MTERTTTPPRGHGPVLFTGLWYVVALSVVSEVLAYLTVGLGTGVLVHGWQAVTFAVTYAPLAAGEPLLGYHRRRRAQGV